LFSFRIDFAKIWELSRKPIKLLAKASGLQKGREREALSKQRLMQAMIRQEYGGKGEKELEDASAKESIAFMPLEATPMQVIGLVESVEQMGSPVELSSLVYRFRDQTPNFFPVLKAAEELGLLKTEGGFVFLTNLGAGFIRASDNKIRILRASLHEIEPFKSAIEMLSKRERAASSRAVAEYVARKYPHSFSRVNQEAMRAVLIEWGISSELLALGPKGTFHLA
jgi:hypothetical protein